MQRSAVQKRVQAGWKNLKGQNEQSAKISKQNQLAKKSKGQKKNTQNENIKKFSKKSDNRYKPINIKYKPKLVAYCIAKASGR